VTVRIRVCRDCCCGTPEKHPDVDHDALLAELVAGTRDHAHVSVTTCLLACDRSNVVVVSPGPYWFGRVLTRQTVAEVAAWVRAGGPEVALPKTLQRHRIRPPLPASTAANLEAASSGDAGA
jgi:(2Fe-2S) ferredoxin